MGTFCRLIEFQTRMSFNEEPVRRDMSSELSNQTDTRGVHALQWCDGEFQVSSKRKSGKLEVFASLLDFLGTINQLHSSVKSADWWKALRWIIVWTKEEKYYIYTSSSHMLLSVSITFTPSIYYFTKAALCLPINGLHLWHHRSGHHTGGQS